MDPQHSFEKTIVVGIDSDFVWGNTIPALGHTFKHRLKTIEVQGKSLWHVSITIVVGRDAPKQARIASVAGAGEQTHLPPSKEHFLSC